MGWLGGVFLTYPRRPITLTGAYSNAQTPFYRWARQKARGERIENHHNTPYVSDGRRALERCEKKPCANECMCVCTRRPIDIYAALRWRDHLSYGLGTQINSWKKPIATYLSTECSDGVASRDHPSVVHSLCLILFRISATCEELAGATTLRWA